eukprot:jgi/Tetstr1/463944/TSEL_008749.t1
MTTEAGSGVGDDDSGWEQQMSMVASVLSGAFHSAEAEAIKDTIKSRAMLNDELARMAKRSETDAAIRTRAKAEVDQRIDNYISSDKGADAMKALRDALDLCLALTYETSPVDCPDGVTALEGENGDDDNDNGDGGASEPSGFPL